MNTIEKWVTAVGFSRYEVSSLGRLSRDGHIINGYPEKSRKGYLRTTLVDDGGNPRHVAIHRLICTSFHGPAPSRRHHAAHKNGNNTANASDNLRWATPAENEADKLAHGRIVNGERAARSKLTAPDVIKIRAQAVAGDSQRAIAGRFRVSQAAIAKIVSYQSWRHV